MKCILQNAECGIEQEKELTFWVGVLIVKLFMANMLRLIIFLLAFALLIQNTCPFGAAGKSTVTSSCQNCPSKHNFIISPNGQKNLVSDSLSSHFSLHVFTVPKTIHVFQLYPIKSARPILADRYKDAMPDELMGPPRA